MRRAVLILVLLLGLAGALGAQTQHGSWSSLNRLKAGQGIEVIESGLKQHVGKFVAVTDARTQVTGKANFSPGITSGLPVTRPQWIVKRRVNLNVRTC
jgi:hypothetical protein